MKIVLLLAALAIVGVYCTAVGMLTWRQRRILYAPETVRPDLSAAGVAGAQVLTVRTRDGLDLLAWWAPPENEAMPVVLYLHGNGGHIGYRAHRFAYLNSLGWGVLLLEYRGFGGNPGSPTEQGLNEDARAAHAALVGLGIAAHRVVPWGESLGTGIAVRLATEVDVGAILLESPYTSIMAMAQKRYPFVPVRLLLRDRFDLIGRIAAIRAPLLVMTGGRDEVVPPAMGQQVFAAAHEPKVFWFAPDAGHNGLTEAGAFDAIQTFVRQHWKTVLSDEVQPVIGAG